MLYGLPSNMQRLRNTLLPLVTRRMHIPHGTLTTIACRDWHCQAGLMDQVEGFHAVLAVDHCIVINNFRKWPPNGQLLVGSPQLMLISLALESVDRD
jgi:hypothetical protein